MPRRENAPGFGRRIERVRARVDRTKRDFAKLFGVTEGSYRAWVLADASTGAITLKRGLSTLGVWDLDRALSWLADGQGSPPRWLDDPSLDPIHAPEELAPPDGGGPPRPGMAMPQAALIHFQSARAQLGALVVQSGGVVSGSVLRSLAEMDDALRILAEPARAGALPVAKSSSTLPRDIRNDEAVGPSPTASFGVAYPISLDDCFVLPFALPRAVS